MSDDKEMAIYLPMDLYRQLLESAENNVSLRDRFAGQALVGFCANDAALQEIAAKDRGASDVHRRVADLTYRYADAMLKAREQGEEG